MPTVYVIYINFRELPKRSLSLSLSPSAPSATKPLWRAQFICAGAADLVHFFFHSSQFYLRRFSLCSVLRATHNTSYIFWVWTTECVATIKWAQITFAMVFQRPSLVVGWLSLFGQTNFTRFSFSCQKMRYDFINELMPINTISERRSSTPLDIMSKHRVLCYTDSVNWNKDVSGITIKSPGHCSNSVCSFLLSLINAQKRVRRSDSDQEQSFCLFIRQQLQQQKQQ